MKDMINEENLLKVEKYIEYLCHNNNDSLTNFNFFLGWIDNNFINLNMQEIIALVNNNDSFKKMIYDVCILNKINYDNKNLHKVTFIKNMLEAYKKINEIEEIEKELEDFNYNININENSLELAPLRFYLNQAPKRLLTREEVIDLCKKRDLGSQSARNILIEYNLRLVISIAKKYQSVSGLDFMDLVQAGNEGLLIAAERFNYKLGWTFATYACYWIRQTITRTIANESRIIRVPTYVHEDILTVKKAMAKYYQAHEEMPDQEKLVDITKLSTERVASALSLIYNETVSLNSPVDSTEGCDTELGDIIVDKTNDQDSIDEKIYYDEIKEFFENSNLTNVEKNIIKYRYGFVNGKNHTLDEIGKILNISRERVRQVESKAIRKLRVDPKFKKLGINSSYYYHFKF